MTPKDTTFPYEFFENFAKLMSEAAGQQSQWWEQMGLTSLTQHQFQDFVTESQNRVSDFMRGLEIYKQMDFKRDVEQPPVIWAMGSCKLYDYSQTTSPDAPVLLVIPSLINRAYVLDLVEDTSFLRKMAASGIRPFLLDWGVLSDAEREFSLADYLNHYLLPALEHVKAYTRRPISLMGYCMGGMLAMAAAEFRPDVQKLVLLASPWDFHEGNEWLIPWLYSSSMYLDKLIDQQAQLPVEIIQYMFAVLNPLGVIRKFRQLPQLADNIDKLQEFAIVEDWLNDCVPLAPKVAKEILFDWYRDNKPAQGQWRLNKKTINPKGIHQPTLIITPQNDKIVPPESGEALTKYLPNHHILRPETGHIGAVIGSKSDAQVLQPIIRFIKE